MITHTNKQKNMSNARIYVQWLIICIVIILMYYTITTTTRR